MHIWTLRPRWHVGVSWAWSAWLVGVEVTADDPRPDVTVYGVHLHIGPFACHLSYQAAAT
jgi:hypothetical protein